MKTWQEHEPTHDEVSPYSLVVGRPGDPGTWLQELTTLVRSGLCLTAWALLGVLFWTPRLVGGLLLSAVDLARSAAGRTRSRHRHLRRAGHLYQSLIQSMESARTPRVGRQGAVLEHVGEHGPVAALATAVWTVVVWYAILWSAGVVDATPLDIVALLSGGAPPLI